jgi:Phage integrase SAM-like domain
MPFTAYRSIRLERGLSLEERERATCYAARASVNGETHHLNTETSDYQRAERLARSWFRRLTSDPATSSTKTMKDAAKSFLADIRQPVKREFYSSKWDAISEFFNGRDLEAITTPVLKEFIRWRKQRAQTKKITYSASTAAKDLVCLRRILHHAVEEGWLANLPLFPKRERIPANPRPWLDGDEWSRLQRIAKQRIDSEQNPRTKAQREELYDFCLMMVHSCARVDELRKLRVRDCVVKTLKGKDRPYLEMRIQGKTGPRKSIAWSGAVSAYERLVARRKLQPDDLLFNEHHRDGFRQLLDAADLRRDALGNTRNLKSLRSTGLMMKIRANPRINLKLLAENVGTSVSMLDTFYLKRLTVDMGVEELV